MNVRSKVLGLVVLGGALILLLALFGVFSPSRTKPARPPEFDEDAPEVASAEDDRDDAPRTGVSEEDDDEDLPEIAFEGTGFLIEGKDWVLTAPKATFESRKGAKLVRPRLEYTYRKDDEVARIIASADLGRYEGSIQSRETMGRVSMSDNVRAEYLGETKAVLKTDAIRVDLETLVVFTESPIEFTAHSAEGEQAMTGVGAALDLRKRAVRIEKNISVELTGGAALFEVPEDEAEKPDEEKPPVTHAVCGGPVVGDGFKRTVTLNGGVSVTQGENTLKADTIEVLFGEKADEPRRLSATGHVRLKAAGAEAECHQLVRSTIDDQIVLTGDPAVASYGANRISAGRIAISASGSEVAVPAPGELSLVQPATETEPERNVEIAWTSSLRFDRNTQKAVVRGNVNFDYAGLVVSCQTLTVQLDEDGKNLLEARAEENVKVTADLKDLLPPDDPRRGKLEGSVNASARELTWRSEAEELVLNGEATLDYTGQTLSGERIVLSQADSTINIPGPGDLHAVQGEGEDAEPLAVAWQGGMDFALADREVVFDRDIVLTYQGRTLQADKMTATLGDDNTLSSFVAEGRVRGTEADGATFTAKTVTAELGEGNVIESLVAEGGIALEKAGEWEVAAEKMTASVGETDKIESVSAEGKVSVTLGEGRTLKADKAEATLADRERIESLNASGSVEIRMEEDPGEQDFLPSLGAEGVPVVLKADTVSLAMDETSEEPAMKQFDALGHVVIEQGEIRATGDALRWTSAGEEGVMTGTPVVFARGPSQLVGERVEFSGKDDRVSVTGRGRVTADIFTERGKLGDLLPRR